jgi:hypothetical protein
VVINDAAIEQLGEDASEVGVTQAPPTLRGEDAAAFDLEQQDTQKWIFFSVELLVVLGILYAVRHPTILATPCRVPDVPDSQD